MANNSNESGKTPLWKVIILGIITFGLYFLFRKSDKKKSVFREWSDAILFAVIAATIIRTFFIEAFTIPTSSMEKSLLIGDFLFVSKVSYGARIPMTPLSFPFAHHTLPLTEKTPSYLEWIKFPYMRLPGLGKIKNNDIVVFNYPMEDFRPVDKQEHYIKRCVGIPGDKLEVKEGVLYINDQMAEKPEKMQHRHHVRTDGSGLDPQTLLEIDVTEGGRLSDQGDFELTMTAENAEKVKAFANVVHVEPTIEKKSNVSGDVFPQSNKFPWNVDNFGAITIPKEGETVQLNIDNLPMYRRIIEIYEGNKLEVNGDKISINGVESNSYTFKMNYFFMMGDNRHNSLDSRFWGFVPDDHIVGKAVFIWLSLDNNATSIFNKIRWERVCVGVNRDGITASYFLLVLLGIGGMYGYSWYKNRKKPKKA